MVRVMGPWARAVAVVLALASGGATAAPGVDSSGANVVAQAPGSPTRPSLTVTPTGAIAGEPVTVTGRFKGQARRKVVAQARTGSSGWSTVAKGRTKKSGRFSLGVTSTLDMRVRVVAPKAKGKAKLTSKIAAVAAAAQTVTVTGPSSVYVGKAFTLSAAATPARAGQPITVQEQVDGGWAQVASGVTGPDGRASFEVSATRAGAKTYRAVTGSWNGIAPTASVPIAGSAMPDPTVVSDDVHVLDDAEVGAITSYDPATGDLVLDDTAGGGTALDDIVVGAYLPIPPRDGLASGALVEVTRRTVGGDDVRLTTVPADLPDVVVNVPDGAADVAMIPDAQIEVDDVADGVTVEALPEEETGQSGTGKAGAQRAGTISLEGPSLSAAVSLSLTGDAGPAEASVTVSGSAKLTPVLEVGIDMDWATLKSYKVGAGLKVRNEIKLDAEVSVAKAWKKDLFSFTRTFGGSIGPVPVWADLTGKVVLKAKADGSLSYEVVWTQTGKQMSGVTGTQHAGYAPTFYRETATGAGRSSSWEASGHLEGGIQGDLELSLYSIGGPFLTLGYQAKADVTMSSGAPQQCKVAWGPYWAFGFRTSELIKKLSGQQKSFTAVSGEVEAGTIDPCAGGGVSAPQITTTTLPDATVGEAYDQRLQTADNRGGTWSVTSGALPAGLSLGSTGRISGTPSGSAGTSSFTVGFVDGNGLSASRSLTITVIDTGGSGTGEGWKNLTTSSDTSCGIRTDGTGWCWGWNYWGQVGDGTTTDRSNPVQLPGTWKTLTTNVSTSCGVQTDDTGWCWGRNDSGQVGDGTTTERSTPVQLRGTWKTLTTTNTSSCGIQTDDTGWCWGDNASGQVGDGTTTDRSTPVQLPGTWKTLTTGLTSCGIQTDDTGWCWGFNASGQVGDGTTTNRSTPVQLPGSWKTLTAGLTSCGTRTDGTGWCWGYNDSGQVGDGTTTDQYTPVQLPGSWKTLTTTDTSSCGIQTDDTGWCWGRNGNGQVRDGTTTDRSTPVQLPGSWKTLTGGLTSCGTRTDGTGWCWGYNGSGQVGDGTTTDRSTPVQLP